MTPTFIVHIIDVALNGAKNERASRVVRRLPGLLAVAVAVLAATHTQTNTHTHTRTLTHTRTHTHTHA